MKQYEKESLSTTQSLIVLAVAIILAFIGDAIFTI
jgi:23S rRNA maturation mini-RNase III